MNMKTPSTAAAGRMAGTTTCQYTRSRLQPSVRAASMSSLGTFSSTAWRIQNTENALTSAGRITACSLAPQPSSATSMYSGMMPSWVGTIIVAITVTSSALRPRKCSLANAKPASEANSTFPNATELATISEFCIARANSLESKTRWMFSNRWPPGTSGGVASPITLLSLLATTNDQYMGKKEASSTAARTRYDSGPGRRWPGALRARAAAGRAEASRVMARSLPGDHASGEHEVDQRHHDDDQEQHPRDGGRVPGVEEREALLVQVHGERLELAVATARAGREAVGGVEQERLGEELETADGRDDRREDHGRPDHRDRDAPERAPRRRAVHARRLVDVGRDRLHRGQVDQRVVPGPPPRDDHADRDVRGPAVCLPVDRPVRPLADADEAE